MSIQKRFVLITGVAGGIGYATAERFHDEGWTVFGVDRRQPARQAAVDHFIQADIADAGNLAMIFSQIRQQTQALDALVNNAAIQIVKPLVETTPEEWDATMGSNVRSVYLAIKHAHPLLQQRGGSIVNVSSVHAIATSGQMAAYATSKGALSALTRAAAIELAADNIRVNAILPGAIDTPMLHAGLARHSEPPPPLRDRLRTLGRRHVIGRIGKPADIARAILFLADDTASGFMTGQSLIVDGGATIKLSTE
jgi:NAD(P)-dependent dehydrogenase (short-subunit alcohol dehydrogenase family)